MFSRPVAQFRSLHRTSACCTERVSQRLFSFYWTRGPEEIRALSGHIHTHGTSIRALTASANEEHISALSYASRLRNISIVAHVDHGKSTLSDCFLRRTGAVSAEELSNTPQYLDSLSVERERGITIKLRCARLSWANHVINIVDTPGHCDFVTQVGQSLSAVDGVVLVVDATKGVQAQTLANLELAKQQNLAILPVLNKIDLPTADPDRVLGQLADILPFDPLESIVLTSAKTGEGIDEALDSVIKYIPPPSGIASQALQAIIFDSYHDPYRGIVVFVRIFNGAIKVGDTIQTMLSARSELQSFVVSSLGFLAPHEVPCPKLVAGDVGYLTASFKRVDQAAVGDTITHFGDAAASAPLPSYCDPQPVVWCGLFPADPEDIGSLRKALEKLQLTDTSLVFESDKSPAMGSGFRCGFLGLLHAATIQERLEKDFDLDLIASAPSVTYRFRLDGKTDWQVVSNPAVVPSGKVTIQEPYAKVDVLCSAAHVGPIMDVTQKRRGEFMDEAYVGQDRVRLSYSMPLSEVVTDYYDVVKSLSSGYATMDYQLCGMKENPLARMDILVAGERVDGLCVIVHREQAYKKASYLVSALKARIPPQLFKVAIQACIGGKIIASEHIKPQRKDVLAKCYGGDVSRKKKLLQKQAEGKKRMKTIGRVNIPQDAFFAVLCSS